MMYSRGLPLWNHAAAPCGVEQAEKMDIMEIVLLIAGGIIFILSFIIPDRKDVRTGNIREEDIRDLVNRELESVRNHVDEVVEEAVTYAMEKTERSLERLSNEKIMAVNEYSDTVLTQIHKNHEETMFLYDMLNNKHENLKNAMSEVSRTVKEAEQVIDEMKSLSPEAVLSFQEESEEAQTQVQTKADPWDTEISQENKQTEQRDQEEEESLPEIVDQERNNNEKILALYGQEKTAVTIARELGLGVGEVKLVIDLFQK